MAPGTAGLALVAAGTAAALVASALGRRAAYGAAKAVASGGFVWIAIGSAMPARTLPAGLALAGIAVAAAGDVILAAPGRRALFAGVGCFALAHTLSATAFLLRAGAPWMLGAGAGGLGLAAVVRRWVGGQVDAQLLDASTAYAAVAGVFAVGGLGAAFGTGAWLLGLGAALVAGSDLAVAAERFFDGGLAAKAVGLPAYYAGQALVAIAIAAL